MRRAIPLLWIAITSFSWFIAGYPEVTQDRDVRASFADATGLASKQRHAEAIAAYERTIEHALEGSGVSLGGIFDDSVADAAWERAARQGIASTVAAAFLNLARLLRAVGESEAAAVMSSQLMHLIAGSHGRADAVPPSPPAERGSASDALAVLARSRPAARSRVRGSHTEYAPVRAAAQFARYCAGAAAGVLDWCDATMYAAATTSTSTPTRTPSALASRCYPALHIAFDCSIVWKRLAGASEELASTAALAAACVSAGTERAAAAAGAARGDLAAAVSAARDALAWFRTGARLLRQVGGRVAPVLRAVDAWEAPVVSAEQLHRSCMKAISSSPVTETAELPARRAAGVAALLLFKAGQLLASLAGWLADDAPMGGAVASLAGAFALRWALRDRSTPPFACIAGLALADAATDARLPSMARAVLVTTTAEESECRAAWHALWTLRQQEGAAEEAVALAARALLTRSHASGGGSEPCAAAQPDASSLSAHSPAGCNVAEVMALSAVAPLYPMHSAYVQAWWDRLTMWTSCLASAIAVPSRLCVGGTRPHEGEPLWMSEASRQLLSLALATPLAERVGIRRRGSGGARFASPAARPDAHSALGRVTYPPAPVCVDEKLPRTEQYRALGAGLLHFGAYYLGQPMALLLAAVSTAARRLIPTLQHAAPHLSGPRACAREQQAGALPLSQWWLTTRALVAWCPALEAAARVSSAPQGVARIVQGAPWRLACLELQQLHEVGAGFGGPAGPYSGPFRCTLPGLRDRDARDGGWWLASITWHAQSPLVRVAAISAHLRQHSVLRFTGPGLAGLGCEPNLRPASSPESPAVITRAFLVSGVVPRFGGRIHVDGSAAAAALRSALRGDPRALGGILDLPLHCPRRRSAPRAGVASEGGTVALSLDLDAARRRVVAWAPDVAVFPDLGMDGATYALAHGRLAPFQLTTVGHPVSSGVSTVDGYLTHRWLLPSRPELHYTELPLLLPHLPVFPRQRPVASASDGGDRATRRTFGLPARPWRLYGCLQAAAKLHPRFDAALAGVLARDPRAVLILLAPSGVSDSSLSRVRDGLRRSEGLDALCGRHTSFWNGAEGGGPPSVEELFVFALYLRLANALACVRHQTAFPGSSPLLGCNLSSHGTGEPARVSESGRPPSNSSGQPLYCVSPAAALASVASIPPAWPAEEGVCHHRQLLLFVTGEEVVSRVRVMPRMSHGQYAALISLLDVALDPFPTSGGVTTQDVLSADVPIVSFPAAQSTQTFTRGFLLHYGLPELLVPSRHRYASRALLAAKNRVRALRLKRAGPSHAPTLQALLALLLRVRRLQLAESWTTAPDWTPGLREALQLLAVWASGQRRPD